MKILLINPNTTQGLTDRLMASAAKFLHPAPSWMQ